MLTVRLPIDADVFLSEEIVVAWHGRSLSGLDSDTELNSDTLVYVKSLLHASGVVAAAVVCAAVFGVGVPLLWVWVASKAQPTNTQGTSELAALIVIVGPLASFFTLVALMNRFSRRERPAQHMAWMRSRGEVRQSGQKVTAFDQVVILTTLIVVVGFEIWFFFFAQCPTTQCFGQ